ncbi:MAG: Mut7-C RNAse domain-containing protein [Candidatus Heimdallarchaeota archaeon]
MKGKVTEKRQEKFIVDRMYFRIARWLRMLSYDTIFEEEYADYVLIKRAIDENRIIITRDEDLKQRAQKYDVKVVTIDAKTAEERLAKLSKETGIELSFSTTQLPRCSVCNAEIEEVAKEEIEEKVKEGTKNNYNEFWLCTNEECKQIYWKGSHWEQMEKSLKESRKYLE